LHTTILDVVATTRYAIDLWGDAFRPGQHAREVSFFIGIPAGVLAALGCLALGRRRDYGRLALLAGVPLLFNLVAFGKIWQSRQLLPMTPFLAALAILGWRHVVSASRDRGGTPLKWTVIAVCALAWIAPAALVRVSDGPRAPYGRLWTPVLWKRWQAAVDSNQAEIRALVDGAGAGRTAIITDTWDGDRYVHLALQETGYRAVELGAAVEGCERSAETFARGDRLVLHIRLHQPFLPNWRQLAAARLGTLAMPCVAHWSSTRLVRLAPFEQLRWSMTDAAHPDVRSATERALAIIARSRYSPQLPVEMQASDLESLRLAYLRQAEQEETLTFGRPLPAMALGEAERRMAPRVWASPPRTR
ncbi:MAG TPA: hypothetical protein VFS59_04640, partial [Gemmatimonadaceae bacterium]|nr:hypothetical protein [Gemmatimonadaceae bacterium]